jgi:hypothetical protein
LNLAPPNEAIVFFNSLLERRVSSANETQGCRRSIHPHGGGLLAARANRHEQPVEIGNEEGATGARYRRNATELAFGQPGSMHQAVMLDCHQRTFDVPIVSLYFVVVSTF